MPSDNGHVALLALYTCVGWAGRRVRPLVNEFGNAERALQQPWGAVKDLLGTDAPTAAKWAERSDPDRIWRELVGDFDGWALSYLDADFPECLREIDDGPVMLFGRGDIPRGEPGLGVVGTRRCTSYGPKSVERLVPAVAAAGVVIVSGLARGIDGAAHECALAAGGKTWAVLGGGVNQIYPAEHRELAERIVRSGAVMSEYPPYASPEARYFPARNRIISALSQAVLVVEAPVKSGALITVTWAMEQGKDILAVPGNITSSVSEGSNRLIRDGATPILNSGDLLTALGLTVSAEQAVRPVTLSLDQSLLLNAIPDEPVPVDSLVEVLGWPPEKVQVTALELELLGMLQQFPGALLVRTAAVW